MRGKAPIVLEMPLYRKNGAGRTRRHCDGAEQGVCLRLNDEERAQGQDDRRLQQPTSAEFGVNDDIYLRRTGLRLHTSHRSSALRHLSVGRDRRSIRRARARGAG